MPSLSLSRFLTTSAACGFAILASPVLALEAEDGGIDAAVASEPSAPNNADASSDDSTGVIGGDIVVTARRRAERAQDVPVALTAVSGDLLEQRGDYTLGSIQQIAPSLQVFSFNPRNTNVNIRGLGSNISLANDGLENGVGFYIDDVYYGRTGQSQFELVDLERIEILRGPQGTLFGKNTTAGAINITSRKPEFTFGGFGEVSLGDYDFHQVRGSITGPLTDWVAFRLSVSDTHRDGFLTNVTTGEKVSDDDNLSLRGQLLLNLASNASLRVIGDYSKQTMNCCLRVRSAYFGTYDDGNAIGNNFYDRVNRAGYAAEPIDPWARRVEGDAQTQANMDTWGVSGKLDWDLGSVTLSSISAYRHWNWYPRNDSDGTGLAVQLFNHRDNHQRQFSQEFRLASNGDDRLSYVLGAYYFWQVVEGPSVAGYGADAPLWQAPTEIDKVRIPALSGFISQSYSDPETRSYALFGQTSYQIVPDRLTATLGLRYTHEKKNGSYTQVWTGGADLDDPALGLTSAERTRALALRNALNPRTSYSLSTKDDSFSGLFTLAYNVTRDIMVYGSYSRGNKSGGLNLANLPTGVTAAVDPEKVDNFEAGIKSQWLDRRLTLNAAAFHTKVTDYQTGITEQVEGTNSTRYYIANITEVISRGFELDGNFAASRNINFNGSVVYVDAYYGEFQNGPTPVEELNPASGGSRVKDMSGAPLSGAPKWSWNVGSDFNFAVGNTPLGESEVYGRADFSWRSSYYTEVSNSRYSKVPSFGVANARLGIRSESGAIDFSVWVKNVFDKNYFTTLSVANTGLATATLGDPRTVGATLRSSF